MVRIAFYLNLQGSGHCRRFEAIAPYFPVDTHLAVVGMDGPPPLADLDRDVECVSVPGFAPPSPLAFMQEQTARDYHDFLVNHGGNAAFTLAMVSFLSRWQPDLLVVDVGLEASILARMCGIPSLYARQHGERWDKGHCLAYEWACSLWAPFSAQMEQADCPEWIRQKTLYSGGFCRFSGKKRARVAPAGYSDHKPNVLVMTGFGGTDITPQKIAVAAAITPHWQWHLLGDHLPREALMTEPIEESMENIHCHGVVEDVWPYLCYADLVIANAGHNSIMEIGAAGVPSVFIPAERPFAEQQCKAETIRALGLGIVVPTWPQRLDWGAIWNQTRSLDYSAWHCLQDENAPRRAADHIVHIAKQCARPVRAGE
ncbi:MAG: glycosyltransferase [Phormidesmis sp.]